MKKIVVVKKVIKKVAKVDALPTMDENNEAAPQELENKPKVKKITTVNKVVIKKAKVEIVSSEESDDILK